MELEWIKERTFIMKETAKIKAQTEVLQTTIINGQAAIQFG